jgi:hypothetical protein
MRKKLKALLYGKYGVGKTTLAGTAVDVPAMSDVFLISAEAGEMSLIDNALITLDERIDVVQISSFKKLQLILDYLRAHVVFRNNNDEEKLKITQDKVLSPEDNPDGRLRKYNTVIIDSLTELNDLCMADLLGLSNSMSFAADLPTAEFKEYKQNFNKMQMLVRSFRDLDMNVIITAATSYDQDELKAYHYTVSLTGKLSNQVQGFFDVVGFLVVGPSTEDKAAPRRLWLQPVGGKFDAKSRLSKGGKAYLDNPSMMGIMKEAGLTT